LEKPGRSQIVTAYSTNGPEHDSNDLIVNALLIDQWCVIIVKTFSGMKFNCSKNLAFTWTRAWYKWLDS